MAPVGCNTTESNGLGPPTQDFPKERRFPTHRSQGPLSGLETSSLGLHLVPYVQVKLSYLIQLGQTNRLRFKAPIPNVSVAEDGKLWGKWALQKSSTSTLVHFFVSISIGIIFMEQTGAHMNKG